MSQLLDVGHVFGSDLQLSNTGDLARVSAVTRSTQRILRRLLTNLAEYIFHLAYGASVPKYVGAILNLAEIKANIIGQMKLEQSVIQNPTPTVTLTPIANGVSVYVSYLVAPDRQPAALSFDVNI
jgi:hypothetical protein